MIVAFTGAGISKASGIPTFSERENLRDRLSRDYADKHPIEYYALIRELQYICMKAELNDAHIALAEYDILVITMNIDGLHQRASRLYGHGLHSLVLPIHGTIPDLVLYGDDSPLYVYAEEIVSRLVPDKDILLVVGASMHTLITRELIELANKNGVEVYKINSDSNVRVRAFLESHRDHIEDFDNFMNNSLVTFD